MLDSSELFHLAKERFEQARHPVRRPSSSTWPAMLARKDEVVKGLTDGVRFLFRKNKVETIFGTARVSSPTSVQVALSEGGSARSPGAADPAGDRVGAGGPAVPAVRRPDGRRFDRGARASTRSPSTWWSIGAGYIGLELGSVWRRLGAKVTVIEFLPRIVPTADQEMGELLKKSLAKQGLEFHLETKVTGASIEGDRVDRPRREEGRRRGDLRVRPGAGRRRAAAVHAGPGAGRGWASRSIPRRARCRWTPTSGPTSPTISAIGDLIDGPMLAHKAEDEGIACAEILAGKAGPRQLRHDPGRDLHLARAGQRRADRRAGEAEGAHSTGSASSRSWPTAAPRRWTRPRAWSRSWPTRRPTGCSGVHILGPRASEMIAEAVTVMEFAGSAEDIARTCHAHPTLSEATREAALAVDGRAIHS